MELEVTLRDRRLLFVYGERAVSKVPIVHMQGYD